MSSEEVFWREVRNSRVFEYLDKIGKAPERLFIEPHVFVSELSNYLKDCLRGEQDIWICIFGYEGSGKSSMSLMLFVECARRIENVKDEEEIKRLIAERTLFTQTEYAKILFWSVQNNKKRFPIILDDAHQIFGKYLGQTLETNTTIQLTRFFRDSQIVHILNTQTPKQFFIDIWFERVGLYAFCFKMQRKDGKGVNHYAVFWNIEESQRIKDFVPSAMRNPLDWRAIMRCVTPTAITRLDFLFPEYTEFYKTYKEIKAFYKAFLSYCRMRGIVKGRTQEIIFKLLCEEAGSEIPKEEIEPFLNELVKKGVITLDFDVDTGTTKLSLDKQLVWIKKEFKDTIKKRKLIFYI
jgi:hypothetical protein